LSQAAGGLLETPASVGFGVPGGLGCEADGEVGALGAAWRLEAPPQPASKTTKAIKAEWRI